MIWQAASADAIRERAREILARPEFAPETQSWVERFFRWLRRFFPDGPSSDAIGQAALWMAVGSVSATIVWIVIREARSRAGAWRARSDEPLSAAAVSRRVEELLAASRAARARGELSLALRLAFFALVVGLARRGDLEYRDAWTNRELVERGSPPAAVRGVLAPLVEALDRKGYGLEPTSEADVDALETLCRRELGSART